MHFSSLASGIRTALRLEQEKKRPRSTPTEGLDPLALPERFARLVRRYGCYYPYDLGQTPRDLINASIRMLPHLSALASADIAPENCKFCNAKSRRASVVFGIG